MYKNTQKYINMCKTYFKKHGNLDVPNNSKYCHLFKWLKSQSYRYNKGTLSNEIKNILNTMNMVWSPKLNDWYRKFESLKKFIMENKRFPYTNENSLGKWIKSQRYYYKKGKLEQFKIQKLNSIGMKWDVNNDKWYENYHIVVAAKNDAGELHLDNKKIANWLRMQINNYNNYPQRLSKEKIDLLEDLGIDWNGWDTSWMDSYNCLKKIYEENPENYIDIYLSLTDKKLCKWCCTQRTRLSKNPNTQTNKKRKELLDSIHFVWDVNETKWETCFNCFVEYYNKHHHTFMVNVRGPRNVNMAQWFYRMRVSYCKNKLSQDKINKFNELGIKLDYITSATSFYEQAVLYYLLKNSNLSAKNRLKVSGYELDIYINQPNLSIGIEVDGKWHRDPNAVERDKRKNKFCHDNNIFLIRIRDKACPSLENNSSMYIEYYVQDFYLNKTSINCWAKTIKKVFNLLNKRFSLGISLKRIDIINDCDEIVSKYIQANNYWYDMYYKCLEFKNLFRVLPTKNHPTHIPECNLYGWLREQFYSRSELKFTQEQETLFNDLISG